MKYKMTRYGNDTTNGAYSYDEIIELTPLDCPASECDGSECECEIEKDELKDLDLKKFGLVSIDSVLKVFDEATDEYLGTSQSRTYRSFIRKAIEQMKRS